MRTWNARTGDVERKWWLIDAENQTVGRMSTHIANMLRGKNKPQFTPHADAGDFVIVINTDKVRLTGQKWTEKQYYNRSRYFGSVRERSAQVIRKQDPNRLIFDAVKGMLPKNILSRALIKKLKLYPGADHPHKAQRPATFTLPSK